MAVSPALALTISGTGFYVPENVVANADLAKRLDTTPEWIEQNSGIQERRHVEEGQTGAELAYQASLKALARSGLAVDDLDMIILATLSPDHQFPGTASFLHAKLAPSRQIPAMDLHVQCAGAIYALATAEAFLSSNSAYRHILVVASEVHSTGLDFSPEAKATSMLFGDGAGALILSRRSEALGDGRRPTFHLHHDGRFAKDLWCEAPGSALYPQRITPALLQEGRHFPSMNGRTVILHAARCLTNAVQEALDANQWTVDDVDFVIPHQANLNLLTALQKNLKLPDEKMVVNIQRYGNTSAASVLIALAEAVESGRIARGHKLVLAGFGSGFAWGSAGLEF